MMLVTLGLEWSSIAVGAGVVGFLFVCLLLILTVLIQRPQGGGLAGAFGSAAGSGQTAFGAKTGDALTIFTIAMFVVYLLAAVGLNYAIRPGTSQPAAAAVAAPAPAAPAEQPQQMFRGTTGPDGQLKLEEVDPSTAPAPVSAPPAQTPESQPPASGEPAPTGEKPPQPPAEVP